MPLRPAFTRAFKHQGEFVLPDWDHVGDGDTYGIYPQNLLIICVSKFQIQIATSLSTLLFSKLWEIKNLYFNLCIRK